MGQNYIYTETGCILENVKRMNPQEDVSQGVEMSENKNRVYHPKYYETLVAYIKELEGNHNE